MLDIDIAFAPDRRMLATAERSARISRDAASVSSKNSATLAPRPRQLIAQIVLGLVTLLQKVVRKTQSSHPGEIIIPGSHGLRKHHLPGHRIAANFHFRSLEPELGRQADRLATPGHKQLCFRHRAPLFDQ